MFFVKEPKVSSENQSVDANTNDVHDDDSIHTETQGEEVNVVSNLDEVHVENNNPDEANHGDEVPANVDVSLQPDIFDPRNGDGLDSKAIDNLVEKGPKRASIQKGHKDKLGRRFSAVLYSRVLPNGEKCDREWLVYSKELNRAFCFCCKKFGKGRARGHLVNEGFSDWIHHSIRLREHETGVEHLQNMVTWHELRLRLQQNKTIGSAARQQLEKEKDHWRKVLLRILLIVKFLAKHNLAFRGTNSKLYQDSNGNFLGLVEMLAEFDPVIQEHVRRITNDETHTHYLGHDIQNELIHLIASAIKSEIIKKIKEAKYFSVILDCTPDASHQEQMSLIIRYVETSSSSISVVESFLGFLDVNDTTGKGLFEVLQDELKNLDLDIDNVRGQSYDNGSNMKGKNLGVQALLLNINPRAFYSACGCHSLNLTLCDMAKTCGKAKDFFGIIQRIYTTFANSTKKWKILKDNIGEGLTLKSVSSTRWESRINSVKAIRFQISDIREALLQVADVDKDPKTSSEAKSLANNELDDSEFVVATIIWYDVLAAVNLISKDLQSKDMLIDVAIEKVQGLITFFKGYRDTGFTTAVEMAREIALEIDIDPAFRKKREIKRKK